MIVQLNNRYNYASQILKVIRNWEKKFEQSPRKYLSRTISGSIGSKIFFSVTLQSGNSLVNRGQGCGYPRSDSGTIQKQNEYLYNFNKGCKNSDGNMLQKVNSKFSRNVEEILELILKKLWMSYREMFKK